MSEEKIDKLEIFLKNQTAVFFSALAETKKNMILYRTERERELEKKVDEDIDSKVSSFMKELKLDKLYKDHETNDKNLQDFIVCFMVLVKFI